MVCFFGDDGGEMLMRYVVRSVDGGFMEREGYYWISILRLPYFIFLSAIKKALFLYFLLSVYISESYKLLRPSQLFKFFISIRFWNKYTSSCKFEAKISFLYFYFLLISKITY